MINPIISRRVCDFVSNLEKLTIIVANVRRDYLYRTLLVLLVTYFGGSVALYLLSDDVPAGPISVNIP